MLPATDKAALGALIQTAQGLDSSRFTPTSWAALQAALTTAQTVYAAADATAEQIASAVAGLSAAFNGLELAAAKSALKTAIDVAVAIAANLDAYRTESVAGLAAALSGAQTVYADSNATQEQVTTAQAALVSAIAGVRLKALSPSASVLPLAAAATAGLAPAKAVAAPAAAAPAGVKVFKAAKPVVKGKAVVGKKLTAKAGAWSASPELSYQWYRGGKAIAKAVKPTYKVKKADAGKRLSVKVTGSKAGYAAKTKASAKTKPVKA
ncbi:MAG: FIVAR domain-containing protein [Bifidobacteriaceae bacterium]|nr:FIVAR domain-containing protein [Bifidobacteriaceae bacterium]